MRYAAVRMGFEPRAAWAICGGDIMKKMLLAGTLGVRGEPPLADQVTIDNIARLWPRVFRGRASRRGGAS
jgi:hypothetical protein